MIKLISGELRNAWLFLAEMVGIATPDLGILIFHESNRRTWDNKMGGRERERKGQNLVPLSFVNALLRCLYTASSKTHIFFIDSLYTTPIFYKMFSFFMCPISIQ